MARRSLPAELQLREGAAIAVLYEDRSVLALDKPPGWMLAPESWNQTSRNLHLALLGGLARGDFWARARSLKYLRFLHRLDADASGVLLCAKHPGVVRALSQLFESRRMDKIYWVIVAGIPQESHWKCDLKLAPDPVHPARVLIDNAGKSAETEFRVLTASRDHTLLEARPLTGRTHQIRVHLAASGHPVLNDPLYGVAPARRPAGPFTLALRAIALSYLDPFQHRRVKILAPGLDFARHYGFDLSAGQPVSG